MTIETLIAQMLEVKQQYPNLERAEILQIFNINAMNDLTNVLKELLGAIRR